MPNHITNKIEIHGDNVEEIKAFAKGEHSGFDFNNFIKMPESLNIESSGRTEYAFLYALTKEFTKEVSYTIREHANKAFRSMFGSVEYNIEEAKKLVQSLDDKSLAEFKELAEKALSNYNLYGVLTWYEWCPKNWGTKWNAYEVTVEDNTITFDTAWNDPEPIIKLLLDKFKFTGRIKSYDEGGWFWYNRLYKDGVLIEDRYKLEEDQESLSRELKGWWYKDEDEE